MGLGIKGCPGEFLASAKASHITRVILHVDGDGRRGLS